MKRKPIQIFLVIAISSSILVSSSFGQYYTLAAADFISFNLKLEAFDQDCLLAANQSELKVSGLGGLFNGFQLVTCLFEQFFHLLSHVPSLDQKNLVLRC
jgi:hypothetical protein